MRKSYRKFKVNGYVSQLASKMLIMLMVSCIIVGCFGARANRSFADTVLYEQFIGGIYTTTRSYRYVPYSGGYGDNPDSSETRIYLPETTKFQVVDFDENYNTTQSKLVVRIIGSAGTSYSTTMDYYEKIYYDAVVVIYDVNGVAIQPESISYPLSFQKISGSSMYSCDREISYIFNKNRKIKDIYLHHNISATSKEHSYDGLWTFVSGSVSNHCGQIIQRNVTSGSYLDKGTLYTKILSPNLYNSNPQLTNASMNQVAVGIGNKDKFELAYSLKDDADDKIYLKYKIMNSINEEINGATVIGIENEDGSDAIGEYALANGVIKDYVSGKIDTSELSHGIYSLIFWAEDDKGAKSAEISKSFEVTSAPTFTTYDVTTNASSVSVNALGADELNALDANPYQFTYRERPNGAMLPSAPTWSVEGTGSFENLLPNTEYEVTGKIKNAKGVISESVKTVFTEALPPVISIEAVTSSTVTVKFNESNSNATLYKVLVGTDKSIDSDGNVVPKESGSWNIPIESLVTVKGLLQGNDYSISAIAKNGDGKETISSNIVFPRTTGGPPEAISAIYTDADYKKITAHWATVENASSYRIKLNGVELSEESVNPYVIFDNEKNGIMPESVYTIEVAAKNGAGESPWKKLQVRTMSQPPEMPNFGTIQVWNKSIELNWDASPRAMKYQLEIDGRIVDIYKDTKYVHDLLTAGSQHIYRLRAVNTGGTSAWSKPLVKVTSMNDMTGKAVLMNAPVVTNNSVVLSWAAVKDAQSYVVQVDDETLVNIGEKTFSVHGGLTKNTAYVFKVYGINPYGSSSLVATTNVTTYHMSVPEDLKIKEGIKKLELSWQEVAEATSYEIKVNETVISEEAEGATAYILIVNDPGVPQKICIRAKKKISENEYEYSSWTDSVTATADDIVPGTANKVRATGSDEKVILTWEHPDEGTPIAYDVMITDSSMNQVVLEAIESQKFVHEGVVPFKTYQYSIRAKSNTADGQWSTAITIKTLPSKPEIPKNIAISNRRSTAAIQWDAVKSALSYEIAVKQDNGEFSEIPVGNKEEYVQKNITYKKENVYKVRAKNLIGYSNWSDLIVNNTIRAITKIDKSLDLGLTATDITDFSKYELQVSYNPGVLEVEDLCGYTSEVELAEGKIEGTDIEVVSCKPGLIKFRVEKGIKEGFTWTGVVNNIKFNPKLSGATYITYTVFVEEN